MELVEATVDDLNLLIDRWYDLAKAMENYSEVNELVYTDAEEVPEDGFRDHLDDEAITDYLIVQNDKTIGFLTLRDGSTRHDRTLNTSVSRTSLSTNPTAIRVTGQTSSSA